MYLLSAGCDAESAAPRLAWQPVNEMPPLQWSTGRSLTALTSMNLLTSAFSTWAFLTRYTWKEMKRGLRENGWSGDKSHQISISVISNHCDYSIGFHGPIISLRKRKLLHFHWYLLRNSLSANSMLKHTEFKYFWSILVNKNRHSTLNVFQELWRLLSSTYDNTTINLRFNIILRIWGFGGTLYWI